MEPVFLARLLRAIVMAWSFSASVRLGFDLDVRDASRLECHCRFGVEDTSRDLVARLRVSECAE
jgi:hypothetical protein